MDINMQGTLTRNLRKPLGISLLHSASDWIFRGFPTVSGPSWTQTSLLLSGTVCRKDKENQSINQSLYFKTIVFIALKLVGSFNVFGEFTICPNQRYLR